MTWEEVLSTEKKEERRLVHKFDCGASVHRQNRSLIVIPPSKDWRAISTGNFNGGFMSSPSAIFNTTSLGGFAGRDLMPKSRDVIKEYSKECARLVDLDPDSVIGLGTAAHMDNAALGSYFSEGIEVSVAITGGIRGNGGRAGDFAIFDEMERNLNKNGTIVIILIVDADLSDSALLGAMMTATEAKSKTILKLMGKSLYSTGIATGSGTDQVVVICNKNSDTKVEKYRNNSRLAKIIKECVENTLAEALDRQSMMNSETQCNPYVMISRYKITEMNCHEEIVYPFEMKDLRKGVEILSKDAKLTATVLAILHIMDEIEWKLIPQKEGADVCKSIILSSLNGPSMNDPVLKRRIESTDAVLDMLKLFMAMMLFDATHAIAAKEKTGGAL